MSTSRPPCPDAPHRPMDCPADYHDPERTAPMDLGTVVADSATPRARMYVIPGVDEDATAELSAAELAARAVEVRGAVSFAGADDDTPVIEQLGMLSKADRATLRRVMGAPTLQDWMDGDQTTAWHVTDARVRHLMAMRAMAMQTARRTARLAPWALVPAVRQ